MAAICSTVPIVRIVQGPSSASSVFRSRSESLTPPFGSQKSSEPSIESGSSFVAIASATFRTALPGASGSIATCSFPAEAFSWAAVNGFRAAISATWAQERRKTGTS